MPLSHRVERVAEQIREEVSQILATEVADPGVGLVTVTRVKVTSDLSLARVYWTIMGDAAQRKETTKALARAAGFVRRLLSQRITLRRSPEVTFQFDQSVAAQDRVEQILYELKQQEAARAAAAPDAPTAPDAPDAPAAPVPPEE
ncbi:MAG TPA: 30S ribosome-binding factor RbfA [Vicinamibacterales bacterium]|nr:30S ribosome-binding factor RbfA [Vicinamibacterales bacterium]